MKAKAHLLRDEPSKRSKLLSGMLSLQGDTEADLAVADLYLADVSHLTSIPMWSCK